MRKKIKIPKSFKMYLIKQLNKLSGLNLNGIVNPKRLTSQCNYPRTQSMDRRIPDLVQYITDHESGIGDVHRYEWLYFPSLFDTESSSSDATTQLSAANRAELSNSTPNSLLAPSSADNDGKEREAGVPVVTFSTDPYNEFKRSMITMLEAYRYTCNDKQLEDILFELASCYLAENENHMHKLIMKACADISMEIRQSSSRCKQKSGVELEEGR